MMRGGFVPSPRTTLGRYRRRAPERTVLHDLVAGHAQTLSAELRETDPEGGGLRHYVERELAAYLRCGILAHGFTRVLTGRRARVIRRQSPAVCVMFHACESQSR